MRSQGPESSPSPRGGWTRSWRWKSHLQGPMSVRVASSPTWQKPRIPCPIGPIEGERPSRAKQWRLVVFNPRWRNLRMAHDQKLGHAKDQLARVSRLWSLQRMPKPKRSWSKCLTTAMTSSLGTPTTPPRLWGRRISLGEIPKKANQHLITILTSRWWRVSNSELKLHSWNSRRV